MTTLAEIMEKDFRDAVDEARAQVQSLAQNWNCLVCEKRCRPQPPYATFDHELICSIECFFEASGGMSKSLMHVKCEGNRSCGMCGGNIMDPLNFDGSTVVYFYGQQGMPDCAVRVHKRCL